MPIVFSEHWLFNEEKEKMEQQMAYNAGYDYAVRKVQEKIKWSDES